jgi:hypothetical protein
MKLVESRLIYDACWVYLVDILIHGRSFEEHLERLGAVLERLEQHNLKLKPSKCFSFQGKLTFLGHVVSEEGIACDPGKISAIANWLRPLSISETRAFCGLALYYRSFVHNFAHIAKPLHEL